MDVNQCLICIGNNSDSSGDEGTIKVLNSPKIIFLLKNLLEVPVDKVEKFEDDLEHSLFLEGKGVRICGKCDEVVEQCQRIYGELEEIWKKYRECKMGLVKIVKGNEWGVKKGQLLGESGIETFLEESWQFAKNHDYREWRDPFLRRRSSGGSGSELTEEELQSLETAVKEESDDEEEIEEDEAGSVVKSEEEVGSEDQELDEEDEFMEQIGERDKTELSCEEDPLAGDIGGSSYVASEDESWKGDTESSAESEEDEDDEEYRKEEDSELEDDDDDTSKDSGQVKSESKSRSSQDQSRGSSSSTSVSRKKRTTFDPSPFQCPHCQKYFVTLYVLEKHIAYIHDKTIGEQCSLCPKRFIDNAGLKRHWNEKHPLEVDKNQRARYTCTVKGCLNQFRTKLALELHKKKVHKMSVEQAVESGSKGDEGPSVEGNGDKASSEECDEDEDDPEYREEEGSELEDDDDSGQVNSKSKSRSSQRQPQSSSSRTSGISKTRTTSTPSPFQCPHCQKYFVNPYVLEKHIAYTHDKTIGEQCSICSKRFIDSSGLKRHWNEKHPLEIDNGPNITYPCEEEGCMNQFKTKLALEFHKKRFHKRSLEPAVKSSSKDDEGLSKEEGSVDNSYFVKCSYCQKEFTWQYLRTHIAVVHEKTKSFKCSICNKNYCDSWALKRHKNDTHGINEIKRKRSRKVIREPNNVKMFPCDQCEEKCTTKSLLNQHIKEAHPFQCEQCGKSFGNYSYLKRHQLVHTAMEKKFVCNFCGNGFATQRRLQVHQTLTLSCRRLRMPENETLLTCPICGKSYANAMVVSQHIRYVHEKKFNIVCEICGKGERNNKMLKKHMAIEHLIGDFPCPEEGCGKVYSRQKKLEWHIAHHHKGEEGEFKCRYCEKSFIRHNNLRQHERGVHEGVKLNKPKKVKSGEQQEGT